MNIPYTLENFPGYRSTNAIGRGVEKNLMLVTWGGLGDQICAEPTLRYALKTFKNCDISLASECPELFRHLQFKDVFDLKRESPIWEKYFVFKMIRDNNDLMWEFMSHMLVNCVDYPSLCAFRCQLPIADREVQLSPNFDAQYETDSLLNGTLGGRFVAIHPGRHWQSKTFPEKWWNAIIFKLIESDIVPVIIGADTDDNRGTVNIDISDERIIDLRNKLSVMGTTYLLQKIKVLLTNDSAPLHMAASGNAWIGYIATAKHPDMITHWRAGQWGWRMKNHSKGGIWDILDFCPNKENEVSAENVGDHLLKWLPDPIDFAQWAIDRLE